MFCQISFALNFSKSCFTAVGGFQTCGLGRMTLWPGTRILQAPAIPASPYTRAGFRMCPGFPEPSRSPQDSSWSVSYLTPSPLQAGFSPSSSFTFSRLTRLWAQSFFLFFPLGGMGGVLGTSASQLFLTTSLHLLQNSDITRFSQDSMQVPFFFFSIEIWLTWGHWNTADLEYSKDLARTWVLTSASSSPGLIIQFQVSVSHTSPSIRLHHWSDFLWGHDLSSTRTKTVSFFLIIDP